MSRADPQETYATWLSVGTRVVSALALVALVLYLSGALAPAIPLADLPRLWTLPASEFLRQAQVPGGWGWIRLVGAGDYLNLLAIALFVLLSLACNARMVAAFLKSGEPLQAALAAAQAAVLLAAASGIFA
jgi:hypothetical protein